MKQVRIKKCEICLNKNLLPVLNIGKHPLCDDLKKIGDKRKNKKYLIDILFCKRCLTAYQKFLIPNKILFPKNYHYRASLTQDVILGMENLVNSCRTIFGPLDNKLILDIGCNDGALLNIFKKNNKCRTLGIEPTDAYHNIKNKHFAYNEYFSYNLAKKIKKNFGYPDIITFTNVFAHINNFAKLIKSLQVIIGPKTNIIIENHYLGSILDKNQFDTFYHEHPRTYSLKSFTFICKLLNLNIIDVEFPNRYGGNIRVYLSKKKESVFLNKIDIFLKKEDSFYSKFRQMKKNINLWKINKQKEIKKIIIKKGKLVAKGFPGRAAIIINLLKINNKHLKCTFEKPDSPKIGHYIPGTTIPILSDDFLFKNNSGEPILNLSWHISDEIKRYLLKNRIKNKVIDVISSKDFRKC